MATTRASTVVVTGNDTGKIVAPFATDPTGDKIPPMLNGRANGFLFFNGYSSSISVTLVTQATAQRVPGVGSVTPASKTLAIAAGAYGLFQIESADMGAYTDASGLVNFTYTSGNAGLLCLPMAH